jgi:DNA-binding transcriptional regulator YiaG
MQAQKHECSESLAESIATAKSPYHYVGSGLDNVYLSGVKYYLCQTCGMQSAEIPALKELFTAIARTIVQKSSPLTGPEVRFLRKRLARKSKDFAEMISVSPERLSSIEAAEKPGMELARDKLIRVIYRFMAQDKQLKTAMDPEDAFERWITSIQGGERGKKILATWQRNHQWRVETEQIAA